MQRLLQAGISSLLQAIKKECTLQDRFAGTENLPCTIVRGRTKIVGGTHPPIES